jgi:Ras GTPase-activating-like protein IQGAP2/3
VRGTPGILSLYIPNHHVSPVFLSSTNIYLVLRSPEIFEITSKTVKITARKNFAQVSKILTQVMTGRDFGDDQPIYIPINDFVREASGRMSAWLLEGKCRMSCLGSLLIVLVVADVPDAESYFYAHEFLDVTVQPKPIYITPNEVYTMHDLLLQHLKAIVRLSNTSKVFHPYFGTQAPQPKDPLRVILHELVGVPNLVDEELKDARDTAITLELTNRFTTVNGEPDSRISDLIVTFSHQIPMQKRKRCGSRPNGEFWQFFEYSLLRTSWNL